MTVIDDHTQSFIEPEDKHKLWKIKVGILLSALVMVGGFFQTQLFVRSLPRPETNVIRAHIEHCRKLQDQLGAQKQPSGIVFRMFSEKPLRTLEEVKESLLKDQALQSELKEKFGISFHELKVVIVPAWALITIDNNDQIGITYAGWKESNSAKGDSDIGGFTLRDKGGLPQITLDGRPRIVLNSVSFQDRNSLRLTLFHELLHAMNVPGDYPSKITFAQNDLVYLPEYRAFVNREKLDGYRETTIWFLAVLIPALILILLVRRYKKIRKRLRNVLVSPDVVPASDASD
ncbi:MAG TPA: hypothetical protein VK388_06115 [Pyrinomonadaceae bacterium]|nr:hypothetical protein [Pyrinomonadaceae bacterium]